MEKLSRRNKWFRPLALMCSLLLILGFLMAALPACKAEEPVVGEETYLMGMLAPLTGSGAAWGLMYTRPVDIMIQEINEEGGFQIGDTTYKIELLVMDSKYSAEVGVAALEKMVAKGIHFMIGPNGTPVVLAGLPLSKREKIVQISYSASPRSFVGETDAPYFWRCAYDWGLHSAMSAIAYVMDVYPERKTWFMVGYDDDIGYTQVAQSTQFLYDNYEDIDCHVALTMKDVLDFAPIITKIRSLDPDMVYFCGMVPGQQGLFIKQMWEAGLDIPTGAASTDVGVILEVALPEQFQGYISSGYVTEGPTAHPYLVERREAFERRYGLWDELAANFWQTKDILKMVLGSTKSLDPDDINYAFEQLGHWEYLGKDIYFGGEEVFGRAHELIPAVPVVEVFDGVSTQAGLVPGLDPFLELGLQGVIEKYGLQIY